MIILYSVYNFILSDRIELTIAKNRSRIIKKSKEVVYMSDTATCKCPEELGIPSGAISAMIDAWEKTGGVHSFMLLRHGKIAAEGWWKPYSPEKPHMLFSLSKSFTAIAAAFAENEGLLILILRCFHSSPNSTIFCTPPAKI